MSEYKLRMVLPFFDGVRFCIKAKREGNGEWVMDEVISHMDLKWEWYADTEKKKCVRAVLVEKPLRVVGFPDGMSKSVFDEVPAGVYLVHDLNRIWYERREEFDTICKPVF
jgi:hypothetical protein